LGHEEKIPSSEGGNLMVYIQRFPESIVTAATNIENKNTLKLHVRL
jgi:hypothetical protein